MDILIIIYQRWPKEEEVKVNVTQREFAHGVASPLLNGVCSAKGSGGSNLSLWQATLFHISISHLSEDLFQWACSHYINENVQPIKR